MICCCTLAGTAACFACPNNPYRTCVITYPPVLPYVEPSDPPLSAEELLARLEKLVEEAKRLAAKEKEVPNDVR